MCQEWQGPTIKNDIKLEVKPDWLDHVNDYQTMYASRADRVNLWQQYKAVTEEQITAYGLGVGRFPAYTSACSHDRLTVPITRPDAGIVGFRGRAFQCDCKSWLTPKGSRMFLFNWEALAQVKGQPLFIVENPIDALLLKAKKNTIAVATLGVTIWKAEYTELIKTANPSKIVVAFDNDRPGNGAGEAGKRKWIAEHGRDIMPNGLRLVNHLLSQGLPCVYLFDWGKAAYGMDIGKLLA